MGKGAAAHETLFGAVAIDHAVEPVEVLVVLVVTNVATTDLGIYSVVATNAAYFAPGELSARVALTILDDTDMDGLPDTYETEHDLNPNDPTDASGDGDGDGMTALEEYVAGTDPNDPASFLRLTIRLDGTVVIEFTAVVGKTYSIVHKDSVETPFWTVLDRYPARSTTGLAEVPVASPGVKRIYRLVTPALP
jgi:hypothetical protein